MKKSHMFISLAVAGALTGSAFALDNPIALQSDGTLVLTANYNPNPATTNNKGATTKDTDGDREGTNVRATASGTLINEGDTIPVSTSASTTNASTTVSDPTSNFDMSATNATTTSTTTISSISDIFSGTDLQAYARWLLGRDESLVRITTKDDRVLMTRKTPAKLLGFIPISTDETAEVISWGDGLSQVTIDRPWWDFLAPNTINKDALSQDIQSRINTIPSTEFGTILSSQTKARIMAEVDTAFAENEYSASTTQQSGSNGSSTGSTTGQ